MNAVSEPHLHVGLPDLDLPHPSGYIIAKLLQEMQLTQIVSGVCGCSVRSAEAEGVAQV